MCSTTNTTQAFHFDYNMYDMSILYFYKYRVPFEM